MMFPLQVLENEIFKFEENICDFEEDLNGGSNIPEDVRDTILTVIGMAKLLMAQKLTQFRELCYKNIVSRGWERSLWRNNKPGAGGKIQIPGSFDKLTCSFLRTVPVFALVSQSVSQSLCLSVWPKFPLIGQLNEREDLLVSSVQGSRD